MNLTCGLCRITDPKLPTWFPWLRAAGFEAAEVTWQQLFSHAFSLSYEVHPNACNTALSEFSSSCLCVSLTTLESTIAARVKNPQTPDRAETFFEFAALCAAPYVALIAADRRTQSLEDLIQLLDSLLAATETTDVNIAIANAHGSRIEQMEDVRELLMRVRHERLKLLVDTGEFHTAAVNPRDAIREFPDRINAVRLTDRRNRVPVQLGAGDVNLHAVLKQLRLYNIPWLVAEVLAENNMEQVLMEIAEFVRAD